MGQIDDAHHAEDDRKPARAQHQKGAGITKLIEEADDGSNMERPAGRNEQGTDGTSVPPEFAEVVRDLAASERQPLGGGLLGVYWALGFFLVRSQPTSPSQ